MLPLLAELSLVAVVIEIVMVLVEGLVMYRGTLFFRVVMW